MPIPLGPPQPAWPGPPALASGHRLFFLFSGILGACAPLLWLAAWRGLLPLDSAWHGHEMLFGFAGAAIGGFLQAAVPKWTDTPPFRGTPVVVLATLWLLGRVGMAVPGAAWLDLLYLPGLLLAMGLRIVGARNVRNYPVLGLLAALIAADVWFLSGARSQALRVVTLLVSALIALVAGRIVPLFTRNALRLAGIARPDTHTPVWLDTLAVPVVLAAAAAEVWASGTWFASLVLGLAALVLGARMLGWRTLATAPLPLVWVLHAGYAFLPLGLVLLALAPHGVGPGSFQALHALTAGGIGVMILAVMSRAALGHAGMPLEPAKTTVLAYGLVIAGALGRIVLTHPHAIVASGCLWSTGFALFVWVYAPILLRPRVDGQPG